MTITGYRWWHARLSLARPGDEKPTVPTLGSWAVLSKWEVGVNRATCIYEPRAAARGLRHWHRAPAHDCECGFWAFTEPTWLPGYYPKQHTLVFGEVELWGDCFFTERGTRAEYARIVSLSVPSEPCGRDEKLTHAIARRYGVPVVPFPLEGEPPASNFMRSIQRPGG